MEIKNSDLNFNGPCKMLKTELMIIFSWILCQYVLKI